jgi:glycosyltransferase involved in cell wall biosynthesis
MVELSAVIPCYNEEGSIPELIDRLTAALESTGRTFEILFVDDGSTDSSYEIIRRAHDGDSRIKAIRFRRNFGKSAALTTGFEAAKGAIVMTLDADLQDDPAEIPRFIAKLDEGFDMVTGWKKTRHDPLEKKLPSRFFNKVTSSLTGIPIHDFNCGFKGYRRAVLEEIEIYGDMHRFIPVLANQKGFRIAEMEVLHHPRVHGRSKYGVERYLRGATDLLTILFLTKFSQRPAHLFGGGGLVMGGLGFLICVYMMVLWFMGHRPIGNRPLLLLGVLLLITGVQFVSIGLLGEMLTKISQRRRSEISVAERLE